MVQQMLVRSLKRRSIAAFFTFLFLWISIGLLRTSAFNDNIFPIFLKSNRWRIFGGLLTIVHVIFYCFSPIKIHELTFSRNVIVRIFFDTIICLTLSYFFYLVKIPLVSTDRSDIYAPPSVPSPPSSLRDFFSSLQVSPAKSPRRALDSVDTKLIISCYTFAICCICFSQVHSTKVKTFVPVMVFTELAVSFGFDRKPLEFVFIIAAALIVIATRNYLDVWDDHNEIKEEASRDPENPDPQEYPAAWVELHQLLTSNERFQPSYRGIPSSLPQTVQMAQHGGDRESGRILAKDQ